MTTHHTAPTVSNRASHAVDVAAEAARRADLDPSGGDVLRVRRSIHVDLPLAGVVARIEGPGGEELARRQVAVARALAERDAPVVELVRPEIQPLLVGTDTVTLWHRLQPVSSPTFGALGRAVRAVHESGIDPPPEVVAHIDPIAQLRACLDAPTPWSGSAAVTELRRRADVLATAWSEAVRSDPRGTVVVHGDPHIDNAIVTDTGLVLLDLEDAGVGPASWDFAPLTIGVERYGVPPEDLAAFVVGYGAAPGTRPGFRVMCDVYELLVTTWAIRCSGDSHHMEHEAEVRVAGLLDGDPTPWTLL